MLTGASTQVPASNKTPACRLVQAPVVVQLIIPGLSIRFEVGGEIVKVDGTGGRRPPA